jgi:hypothetical protein
MIKKRKGDGNVANLASISRRAMASDSLKKVETRFLNSSKIPSNTLEYLFFLPQSQTIPSILETIEIDELFTISKEKVKCNKLVTF